MTLVLGPGEDRSEDHNELHCYAGVVQTLDAFQLLLGHVQDQVRAGKKGVYLDWALTVFDGLKLAQDIGVVPQTSAQRGLSLFETRDCGSSSLF